MSGVTRAATRKSGARKPAAAPPQRQPCQAVATVPTVPASVTTVPKAAVDGGSGQAGAAGTLTPEALLARARGLEAFELAAAGRLVSAIEEPKVLTEKQVENSITAMAAALIAFKCADPIETMLACQAIALHHAGMSCLKRVAAGGMPSYDVISRLQRDAVNLMRGMTDMLEALDRKRGKGGQQRIIIERVLVADGGKAMIANVSPGAVGGGVAPGEGSGN